MTNKEKANKLFANNPEENNVFFTSDGMGFFAKNKANAHAQRFSDKGLDHYKKEDSDYGKQVAAIAIAKAEAAEKSAIEAAKAAEKAELEAIENAKLEADAPKLDRLKKSELLELATGLPVSEENTKAEIIEAIEAKKTADLTVVKD